MKTSVVVTVLNEAADIDWLFDGLSRQTTQSEEIIIVDGGSTDETREIIKEWQKKSKLGKKIKLFQKNGNRSVGRNFGIKQAKHDWLAITDAGCIPHREWLANLKAVQKETKAPVIAGYYQGLPSSRFEEAVIPYALVMPDKVKPGKFLPAARSMMMNRSVWKKLGGFDESLDHNEDFAFAKKIEQARIKIAFAGNALVGWLPPSKLSDFWRMISRFARGDIQAKLLRPKVVLVFLRYLLFLPLIVWIVTNPNQTSGQDFLAVVIFVYIVWSVGKNKRYTPRSWPWLPILQITADLAVLIGSLRGAYDLIKRTKSST